MQNSKPSKRTIDDEISHTLELLSSLSPDSKEYEIASKNLETLCKAKGYKKISILGITPDTLVVAITNIFGIVLILNFERLNVVASKALGFIMKSRLA